MAFLIGENMTGGYGGADILHDCTIGVEKGEIAVVVGPNGAGKSTGMKAVFGMLNLREGRVVMDGQAADLRENPDVKEFYLGMSDEGRKSFRDVRSYRRRKRWLA